MVLAFQADGYRSHLELPVSIKASVEYIGHVVYDVGQFGAEYRTWLD